MPTNDSGPGLPRPTAPSAPGPNRSPSQAGANGSHASLPPRTTARAASPAARRILAVTALALGLDAHALQQLDASDGVAVEAIVSLKEPTRIRIDGAPITDVFGNIHSSQCGNASTLPLPPAIANAPGTAGPSVPAMTGASAVNPGGDVSIACDADKGEVYVRPMGDSARPINLFVSSAHATYTLLLRRADTPADTIVLRDRTPRASRAPTSAPAGPAPSHVRGMKALLVAMASDRIPSDFRVEDLSRPLQLWTEARFTLQRVVEGRGFVGEQYRLQNTSAAPMVLAEPEFDRPMAGGGQVTGVAIEHHNLRPGESTSVYVIRRGDTR